ncbi:hypothetical protein HN014_01370 [Aquimarina sp. TRL1]|uniref:hypothetical protein n=1 Tax=Aquimarina sp. (strain TRL1) TaxID=2736252 RepID=UPI00158F1016|nr:hypothetical protein [Aquimarina sp. TRL1]QKX03618.1 hypothetical protein HN014_01370 [Aquimarina sp. TRL1]
MKTNFITKAILAIAVVLSSQSCEKDQLQNTQETHVKPPSASSILSPEDVSKKENLKSRNRINIPPHTIDIKPEGKDISKVNLAFFTFLTGKDLSHLFRYIEKETGEDCLMIFMNGKKIDNPNRVNKSVSNKPSRYDTKIWAKLKKTGHAEYLRTELGEREVGYKNQGTINTCHGDSNNDGNGINKTVTFTVIEGIESSTVISKSSNTTTTHSFGFSVQPNALAEMAKKLKLGGDGNFSYNFSKAISISNSEGKTETENASILRSQSTRINVSADRVINWLVYRRPANHYYRNMTHYEVKGSIIAVLDKPDYSGIGSSLIGPNPTGELKVVKQIHLEDYFQSFGKTSDFELLINENYYTTYQYSAEETTYRIASCEDFNPHCEAVKFDPNIKYIEGNRVIKEGEVFELKKVDGSLKWVPDGKCTNITYPFPKP